MVNTIILILAVYFLVSFFIPLLILPNYLIFKPKYKIESKEIKQLIEKIKNIRDKEKALKQAVSLVTNRFHPSDPITFLFHLPKLFWNNPNKIIARKGFAYCHIQNLILKTLLLESGKFKEDEIKTRITFTLVLHQYLQVKIKNKWLDVDPWAIGKGMPLGKHLNTWTFLKYRRL